LCYQDKIEVAPAKSIKDEEEMALKGDMIKLLNALKTENSKVITTTVHLVFKKFIFLRCILKANLS